MASEMESTEFPVYKGSCHCGFVKYTARLSLTQPNPETFNYIMTKCNCSICHKSGTILCSPTPLSSFKLLSPQSEDSLTLYTFNTNGTQHRFCPRCGIKCFLKGTFTMNGVAKDFIRINVLTVDGREDGGEMPCLKDVKIGYIEYKNETGKVAEEPFEGSVW